MLKMSAALYLYLIFLVVKRREIHLFVSRWGNETHKSHKQLKILKK
jgi:hypothetical protein